MNWNEFTSIPNGQRVYNHYADECVALANLYHESVIGGSFVGVPSAHMWWNNFGSWQTLIDNYTTSTKPVAGAIFVSRGGLYDQPHGHIGIVTKVHANGTFDTMEQNAGTWRFVGRYTRGMANILGFLIPKKNPAGQASPPSVAETIDNDEEIEMKTSGLWYKATNGNIVYLIVNYASGAYHEYGMGQKGKHMDGAYNNRIAAAFNTGSFQEITASHATAIKTACDKVRTGK